MMVRVVLSQMVEAYEALWRHQGRTMHEGFMAIEKAVLHAGRDMPGAALPSNYLRGLPKACFQNSRRLARRRAKLRYVEGYVVRPDIGFPIHHGWCINYRDELIDVTIEKPEECTYIGVVFAAHEVVRWATTTSTSLLNTGCGVNIELVRELMAR
jgi:hypothetical protein